MSEGWWPGPESNQRHPHFQCGALPTELPGRTACLAGAVRRRRVLVLFRGAWCLMRPRWVMQLVSIASENAFEHSRRHHSSHHSSHHSVSAAFPHRFATRRCHPISPAHSGTCLGSALERCCRHGDLRAHLAAALRDQATDDRGVERSAAGRRHVIVRPVAAGGHTLALDGRDSPALADRPRSRPCGVRRPAAPHARAQSSVHERRVAPYHQPLATLRGLTVLPR